MLCATLSAQMKVCSPKVVGKLCATPSAQVLHSAACRTAPRHSLSSENEGIISECHSIPSGFGDASSTLLPCADLDQARLFQINGISTTHWCSLCSSASFRFSFPCSESNGYSRIELSKVDWGGVYRESSKHSRANSSARCRSHSRPDAHFLP